MDATHAERGTPAPILVGYMDPAKFKALKATEGRQGGVLTMVTSHRAFPDDVALYAVPVSEPAKD